MIYSESLCNSWVSWLHRIKSDICSPSYLKSKCHTKINYEGNNFESSVREYFLLCGIKLEQFHKNFIFSPNGVNASSKWFIRVSRMIHKCMTSSFSNVISYKNTICALNNSSQQKKCNKSRNLIYWNNNTKIICKKLTN